MILWSIAVLISISLLIRDTRHPRLSDIVLCILFAHIISIIAIAFSCQYLTKVIKFYWGNYGK